MQERNASDVESLKYRDQDSDYPPRTTRSRKKSGPKVKQEKKPRLKEQLERRTLYDSEDQSPKLKVVTPGFYRPKTPRNKKKNQMT